MPDHVQATDLDETPLRAELPAHHARRLACEKAEACRAMRPEGEGALILAADTVVAVGRRILPKAEDEATARHCLGLLSGRAHRVYTALALATPRGLRQRLVETRVKVKRLSGPETEAYLGSGEWRGKAGGYAVQGLFSALILTLVGSYSGVVGLPLYEAAALLDGEGYPVKAGWAAPSETGS